MNSQLINHRIRDRLAEIGASSFDVSEAIGKNRNFLNDLMTGKKKSFSADMLPTIAEALRCDVAYLVGLQSLPTRTDERASDEIPVAGSVEPGVWRKAERDPSIGKRVPMRADPRYPAEFQQLWLVRTDTLGGLDLKDGSAILTVRLNSASGWFNVLLDGDLVVAERTRDSDVMRTVLRVKREPDGIALHDDSGDAEPLMWRAGEVQIGGVTLVGVVLQVIRFRA